MSNWDADKMDCYEIWDTTVPAIPSRSRLYNLKPIGNGTPYAESLTSYIVRLAEEHHLTVKALVVQEIFPLLTRSKNVSYLHENWAKGIITLNGASSYTKDWVDALEQLTHNANLSTLTMLIWQNVIGQRNLLRATQAWCPLCYEEWRRNKNDIYHPLVWALKVVNVCSRHCVPLQTRCPHEDCKKTLPLLSRQMRLGYCSHCMRWLRSLAQTS